jgi:hypothetical protein
MRKLVASIRSLKKLLQRNSLSRTVRYVKHTVEGKINNITSDSEFPTYSFVE